MSHVAFADLAPLRLRTPASARPWRLQNLRPRIFAAYEAPETPGIPLWASAASRLHSQRNGANPAPHAGSHFARRAANGKSGRFFEGWYLRAVLPSGDAFAWMFSIEEARGGGERTVIAQVLGPDEVLAVERFGNGDQGWFASDRKLEFGYWGSVADADGDDAGTPRLLASDDFRALVTSGFQLSATASTGCLRNGILEDSRADAGAIEWNVGMIPVLGWGTRGGQGRCTATWLSHLPVFEPGYQVLMAHGIAAAGSSVLYDGECWDLSGAALYCEKNWGAAFPSKWWWVQANAFPDIPDLTVTALGARRSIAGLYEEEIGMVAVHLHGELYEFSNWSSRSLSWKVSPWGAWTASAVARTGHTVMLRASTSGPGANVLGPSAEGMIANVHDAAYGDIVLTLRTPNGHVLLDGVACSIAQVEIGGGPWEEEWVVDVRPLRQPLRGMINLGSGEKVQTCS
jgi:tocopherol cyclase